MTDQLVRNVIDDFVYNSLKWEEVSGSAATIVLSLQ